MRSTPTGARDAGPTDSSINNGRDGMMGRKGTERRTAADKHAITIRLWPALLQIEDEGVADLLGQRQARLPARLPRYMDPPVPPVDITELQLDDISCAKSQSRKQKQNRAVALSHSSGWIAQRKSALHLFGLQISWERREPPMRYKRDAGFSSNRT